MSRLLDPCTSWHKCFGRLMQLSHIEPHVGANPSQQGPLGPNRSQQARIMSIIGDPFFHSRAV